MGAGFDPLAGYAEKGRVMAFNNVMKNLDVNIENLQNQQNADHDILARKIDEVEELKEIVDANYLYYHLNYSPENKNEKVFAKYDNPGAKFGYPVFVVLDQNGKMIHTQDSAVLEEGKGYSKEKVKAFFEKWAPKS